MDSNAVARDAAFKAALRYFADTIPFWEAAMARLVAVAIVTMALANSNAAMAQYDGG